LVREGFVTFTIDLRNHGERRYYKKDDLHGLNSPATAMRSAGIHALLIGRTYFGLNVFDNIRALDYLQTRPEVHPEAIGCVGFSLGGNLTAWLTAIDRRIKAAAIAGSWASWRRLASASLDDKELTHKNAPIHLLAGLSCQTIPDFFVYMDMNISVAIAAPTPMAVAYEYDIWQFEDLQQAKEDASPIKQAYAGFNASDNLHLEFFDGGHRWRKSILPWFTNRLRQSALKN
jgi:dienelactone hydrolase